MREVSLALLKKCSSRKEKLALYEETWPLLWIPHKEERSGVVLIGLRKKEKP